LDIRTRREGRGGRGRLSSDRIGFAESRRPGVLVVDDERHVVDFLAMGLEGQGWT